MSDYGDLKKDIAIRDLRECSNRVNRVAETYTMGILCKQELQRISTKIMQIKSQLS